MFSTGPNVPGWHLGWRLKMKRHEKAEGAMIGGGFILAGLAICVMAYYAVQALVN